MKNKILSEKQKKSPAVKNKKTIIDSYSKYTFDESKLTPENPEKIYFPENSIQASSALKEIIKDKNTATISGSRTGIVGGAVPKKSNALISLENLIVKPVITFNKKFNCHSVKTGAGMKLSNLQLFLKRSDKFFFPIDPTETNASIGGIISTNANGARTFYFGATREWVLSIKVILSDASILEIRRGDCISKNKIFKIKLDKKTITIDTDDINIPETKHNAGYFIKSKMDLIDLFIGSEGTLGIITEAELKLAELPENLLSLTIFLTNNNYIDAVEKIKMAKTFKPLAIEYIDKNSIKLINKTKKNIEPEFPKNLKSLIYIEVPYSNKEEFNSIYNELNNILNSLNLSTELTWAGFSEKEHESMKKIRHAVPECINSIIAQKKQKIKELTKVGTDMAVPAVNFREMMEYYLKKLKKENFKFYIFGHIGNSHLHINIIPKNIKELFRAKKLYKEFAQKAVSFGGSVSAEHGIGKIKKEFLLIQYNEKEISIMKNIKLRLDPLKILNPGVLWD